MREDWAEILDDEIDKVRNAEFIWGEHDCCLWVADVVKAMTGIDYAKDYRGKYKTRREALKLLTNGSMEKIIDAVLPRVEHPSRGDVVLVPKEVTGIASDNCGLCIGTKVVFVSGDGLMFLPMSYVKVSWSIRNG